MMTILRAEGEEYCSYIGSSDVSKIANQTKFVNDEFINERGNNVTDECCKYLLPLIAGERNIKFEGGLPVHIIL